MAAVRLWASRSWNAWAQKARSAKAKKPRTAAIRTAELLLMNLWLFMQDGFQSFVQVERLKVDRVAAGNHHNALVQKVGRNGQLDLRFASRAGHRLALLKDGHGGVRPLRKVLLGKNFFLIEFTVGRRQGVGVLADDRSNH